MIEIEDVTEPFCGKNGSKLTPLSKAHPEIAAEWCFKKNEDWGPSDFSRGSGVKAWWTCSDCNRVYKAQIYSRTIKGTGCPFCSGQKPSPENNLQYNYEAVAREWHPTRNGKLTPDKLSKATKAKKYWWRCLTCYRAWKATIYSRTVEKSCCPHCRRDEWKRKSKIPRIRLDYSVVLNEGKKISRKWYENRDFVPFSKTHPKIASQWHPTKNGERTPDDYPSRSKVKAWWKCKKSDEHDWQATIGNRIGNGSGCPFCNGKRVLPKDSLQQKLPKLAAEWHPSKNGTLTARDVSIGSGRNIRWKCKKGIDHEWRTTVESRTKYSYGCPFCSGKRASVTNSLASLFPEIALGWHPTRNKGLKPSEFPSGSHAVVWWKCPSGHVYQKAIRLQVRQKQPCSKCR